MGGGGVAWHLRSLSPHRCDRVGVYEMKEGPDVDDAPEEEVAHSVVVIAARSFGDRAIVPFPPKHASHNARGEARTLPQRTGSSHNVPRDK